MSASTWFLYATYTTKRVFLGADTITIRLLLAWASFFSAISLALDSDKFERPAYAIVQMFGTEHMWAAYFFLHFIGVHWRMLDPVSRPRCALVINAFGFAVWFVSTASLCWAVGNVGITTSMAFTLCIASGWALYRTGLQQEIVSL